MDKRNPEQPQEQFNPTLTFEIPLQDVDAILSVLAEAPLKFSLNAYMALRASAERQVAELQANAEQVDEPSAEK